MTAVVDFTVPGPRPRTVAPARPKSDSTLFDLVAELSAESGAGSCSEAESIDRIGQLESLQHQVAAAQSAAIHAFAPTPRPIQDQEIDLRLGVSR